MELNLFGEVMTTMYVIFFVLGVLLLVNTAMLIYLVYEEERMTAETYDDLAQYVGKTGEFTDDLIEYGYKKGYETAKKESCHWELHITPLTHSVSYKTECGNDIYAGRVEKSDKYCKFCGRAVEAEKEQSNEIHN